MSRIWVAIIGFGISVASASGEPTSVPAPAAPSIRAPQRDPVLELGDTGHVSRVAARRILAAGVPTKPFAKALRFMNRNWERIENRRYLTLVDYSKPISARRLFILNLKSGKVARLHVSHGRGSDPRRTGTPQKFSNIEGTQASSVGFYVTRRAYDGRFGYSLRLRGLSETNSLAEQRSIVLHPYFVGPGYEQIYREQAGRVCVNGGCLTEGCLGIPHASVERVIDNLKEGSIIYAFK